MPKHPTTIRLDSGLYRKATRQADKAGLTFSGVVHLLLRAFVEGNVQIGVTQYSTKYLEALEKESGELSHQYRKNKANGYSSSQEMFRDILNK